MGYFSYHNSQQAVRSLADQLMQKNSAHVSSHLAAFLDQPRQLVELNRLSMEAGDLDLTNFEQLEAAFFRQIQIYTAVTDLSYSNASGEVIAVGRDQLGVLTQPGSVIVWEAVGSEPKARRFYRINEQRQRLEVLHVTPNFDPRQRLWYQTAVAANQPTWSPILPALNLPVATIAITTPIYRQGAFQGVLHSDLLLSDLSLFLSSLDVSLSGQVFIIDRAGDLVATSTQEQAFIKNEQGQNLIRLPAAQSRNAITQATAQAISQRLASLKTTQLETFSFVTANQRYFVRLDAYQYQKQLDWLIVTVVPAADFMSEVKAGLRQSLLLSTLALLVSLGLAAIIARKIAQPVIALKQTAQSVAAGQIQTSSVSTYITEIESLQQSFQQMVIQLQQAFQSLRESEQKLSTFLESVPIGISVYDPSGEFVFINRKGKEIFSTDITSVEAEQLSTVYQLYVAGSDRLYPTEKLPAVRALQGEGVYVDDIEVAVAGRRIPLEVHTTPAFDQSGQVIYAINAFQDISERRQAEQAQAAFRESTDALFLVSTETGRTVDCNQRAVELFEAPSRASLINIEGHTLQKQPFTPLELAQIRQELHQNGFWSLEIEYMTRKGEPFWGLLSAKPIQVGAQTFNLVRVTDISDRKQAELALQASNARQQAILSVMPDLMYVVDANGIILEQVTVRPDIDLHAGTGLDRTTIFDVGTPQNVQRKAKAIRLALSTGQTQIYEQQIELTGQSRYEEVRCVPMSAQRVLLMFRDISDRKQTEIDLQAAKAAAESASQAKSIFIANISHELRSPLNAILGFAELLQAETTLSPQQRENAGLIYRSGQHLLNIINQVLDLAKIEANRAQLHITQVELLSLLQDLSNLFALKAEGRGLSFCFQAEAALPTGIYADEVKLRQILINLLDNACKFTEQGSVSLRVAVVDLPSEKTVKLSFAVSDTGIGISAEEQALLFQPFSQTQGGQAQQQGTGLGLHISREFVRLMGSELKVESQLGQGSTFQFELVASRVDWQLPAQPAIAPKVTGLAAGSPRYRLLIVDDNSVNRRLLAHVLSVLEVELQEAANGREALERWQTWQPHLIWMDLRMPEMDGLEATRQIRRQETYRCDRQQPLITKIVAISATGTQNLEALALQAGCDDFVEKPFQRRQIFATLQRQLGVQYRYETPSQV
ncbi:ATP-binding protein [Almyronema epifaneia]|uniref:ATP-binding protein n=1 Tax=Almyronema epifaneia TaxID=3114805 RepID=UPI00366D4EF8